MLSQMTPASHLELAMLACKAGAYNGAYIVTTIVVYKLDLWRHVNSRKNESFRSEVEKIVGTKIGGHASHLIQASFNRDDLVVFSSISIFIQLCFYA